MDVLTHSLNETAKRHRLRTLDDIEAKFTEYKNRLIEQTAVRQRMSFALSQILATVKRHEARILDEHDDVREEFDDSPDLVAISLTGFGEVGSLARAGLEGACSSCGRYGGDLRTRFEGTQDEMVLCVECDERHARFDD